MVERFIAKRLYGSTGGVRGGSRPAIIIATAGISVGLIVMIITLAVTMGFRHQIREKVTGFTQHLQVSNYYSALGKDEQPITCTQELLSQLSSLPGVDHVHRFIDKAGILRTDSAFQGFILRGVGPEYDFSFFESYLKEGNIPVVSDSVNTQEFMLSRSLADIMSLNIGDKVDVYFVQDQVKARRLTLSGIYETGFSEYDQYYAITDIRTLQRLNSWDKDLVMGIGIGLTDEKYIEQAYVDTRTVLDPLGKELDETYAIQTMFQLNSGLFAWLDVLNVNVVVILVLMLGIAGFTMISGLLIIIFERTRTIGLLKALGADNMTIRKIFLHMSAYIVGRGMLIGDAISITICLIQQHTGLIPLDASNYYLDSVPMELGLWWLILLNAGIFLLSILMLLGPSQVISRIRPAASMRFE